MTANNYRHTNCFVRDGGRQIQAVAVIRTTSLPAAAEAFGVSVRDLKKFGGRWNLGSHVEAPTEFTLDGSTWWPSTLATELVRHPGVLFWRPIGPGVERWHVGVDGTRDRDLKPANAEPPPAASCPAKRTTVVQCKTCPWRVGADPHAIPAYVPALHRKLDHTIRSGVESALSVIKGEGVPMMACHYSKPDDQFPCAGWLENQIGPGNNLGVRLLVHQGGLPVPKTDGPQHPRFEDTLPKPAARRGRRAR